MTIIKTEDKGHFYRRDGVPAYESSWKEIRELGHIPSATTILNAATTWTLTQWQKKQVGIASFNVLSSYGRNGLNLPSPEDRDTWVDARLAEAELVTKGYAEFGTNFHDGAQAILDGNEWDRKNPWLVRFDAWVQSNVIDVKWTEKCLVHPTNLVAGRADALIDHQEHGCILIDFKTRRLRPLKKKPSWSCSGCRYDKDIRQLAAYSDCMPNRPRVMNIYIHRDEPVEPVPYLWPEEKQEQGLDAFMALANYWCLDKKYDPRTWTPAVEEVAA